jgi:hypothetical protein
MGKVAIVDDDLYPALVFWKWHFSAGRTGEGGYAVHRIKIGRHWCNLKMHRFIMQAGERDIVDHIDGDKLNNQRSNLRLVDTAKNNQNTKKQIGKSGYRGVNFNERDQLFNATISFGGRNQYIGSFLTALDAARAYDQRALELYGPDAMTNARIMQDAIKKLQNEK